MADRNALDGSVCLALPAMPNPPASSDATIADSGVREEQLLPDIHGAVRHVIQPLDREHRVGE